MSSGHPGHPFQKLCYLRASSDLPETLLAASGPYVCCYEFQKGLVAHWPTVSEEEEEALDVEKQEENGEGGDEPPAKKRRLSGNEDAQIARQDSEESVEIISERVKGRRRKPKPSANKKLPDVSHMLGTSNGKTIIVVTADDKCIRVLERGKSGKLRGVSERSMLFSL
jgi:tRNA (guanine-N(7)-)-methyltransferase subunit TRM82